jgi:hypothetical protein
LQQLKKTPLAVGQHCPFRPSFLQAGILPQYLGCFTIGFDGGLTTDVGGRTGGFTTGFGATGTAGFVPARQQSKKTPFVVGQQSPVNPCALHAGIAEHSLTAATNIPESANSITSIEASNTIVVFIMFVQFVVVDMNFTNVEVMALYKT